MQIRIEHKCMYLCEKPIRNYITNNPHFFCICKKAYLCWKADRIIPIDSLYRDMVWLSLSTIHPTSKLSPWRVCVCNHCKPYKFIDNSSYNTWICKLKKNKLYNVVRYRYSIIHHVLLLYHERIKYATLTCTFLYDN